MRFSRSNDTQVGEIVDIQYNSFLEGKKSCYTCGSSSFKLDFKTMTPLTAYLFGIEVCDADGSHLTGPSVSPII